VHKSRHNTDVVPECTNLDNVLMLPREMLPLLGSAKSETVALSGLRVEE